MNLYRETFAADTPDALCLESLLAEMAGLAARLPHEERKHPPVWLGRVLEKLHTEPGARLTLDDLGAEAGVHPVHLSRVFRRFLREGIGEYKRRLRIRESCRYLLNADPPLAELSLLLGFSDQSHFTREFRRVTGLTPNAFRSQLSSHLHQPAPEA
jgi:AraC family transcriptional regulator